MRHPRRNTLGFTLATLIAALVFLPPLAEGRTQVVKDSKRDPYVTRGSLLDVSRVVASQKGKLMRFKLVFRRRASARVRPSVLIKVKRKTFLVSSSRVGPFWDYEADDTGWAKQKRTRKQFILTFPLSAIGSPKSFRWQASVSEVDTADQIPNYPRFARFKTNPGPPPRSKGPALRGPKIVKRGKPVTFKAYWFTPGTPLSVTVKRKSGKGKKRVKGSFTAKAKGKTSLRFKFPNVKWTGKTKVNVCGTPPESSEEQCAGRTVKIAKPPPLPKRVIKFTGSRGTFVIDCLKSRTCKGRLTISNGKTKLVKPRRYTVRAGGEKKIRLRLTKAGRKALGKVGRAKGLGILKAPDGAKVKFTAILKRTGN